MPVVVVLVCQLARTLRSNCEKSDVWKHFRKTGPKNAKGTSVHWVYAFHGGTSNLRDAIAAFVVHCNLSSN